MKEAPWEESEGGSNDRSEVSKVLKYIDIFLLIRL